MVRHGKENFTAPSASLHQDLHQPTLMGLATILLGLCPLNDFSELNITDHAITSDSMDRFREKQRY
jgi:hypothetical protein